MSHNHAAETNISAVQNVKNFTDFVVHIALHTDSHCISSIYSLSSLQRDINSTTARHPLRCKQDK